MFNKYVKKSIITLVCQLYMYENIQSEIIFIIFYEKKNIWVYSFLKKDIF